MTCLVNVAVSNGKFDKAFKTNKMKSNLGTGFIFDFDFFYEMRKGNVSKLQQNVCLVPNGFKSIHQSSVA